MNRMKKISITAAVHLFVFGVVCIFASSIARTAEPHPHIFKAYRLLTRSHYILRVASQPGQEHRHAALKDVSMALEQLRLAAASVHETLPQLDRAGTPYTAPFEVHHHAWMHDVIRQCREAKAELQGAHGDFGGHRTSAIQHIDAALSELQVIVKE